jgi:hypothetical protein
LKGATKVAGTGAQMGTISALAPQPVRNWRPSATTYQLSIHFTKLKKV